jgi:hypothetical protein
MADGLCDVVYLASQGIVPVLPQSDVLWSAHWIWTLFA